MGADELIREGGVESADEVQELKEPILPGGGEMDAVRVARRDVVVGFSQGVVDEFVQDCVRLRFREKGSSMRKDADDVGVFLWVQARQVLRAVAPAFNAVAQ